jgi:hypothetical protein
MKQGIPLHVPVSQSKDSGASERLDAVSVPSKAERTETTPAADITDKQHQQSPAPRLKSDVEEKSMTSSPPPQREERSSEIHAPAPRMATRATAMPSAESKALNAAQDKAEIQTGGTTQLLKIQESSKEKSTVRRASIGLTLHVGHVPDAVREIEKLLSRFNARIIDRQRHQGDEILKVDIAGRNVAEFLDQIKSIGTIDEGKNVSAIPDGDVMVMITIKEQGKVPLP